MQGGSGPGRAMMSATSGSVRVCRDRNEDGSMGARTTSGQRAASHLCVGKTSISRNN